MNDDDAMPAAASPPNPVWLWILWQGDIGISLLLGTANLLIGQDNRLFGLSERETFVAYMASLCCGIAVGVSLIVLDHRPLMRLGSLLLLALAILCMWQVVSPDLGESISLWHRIVP